jgi:hypothetical protein
MVAAERLSGDAPPTCPNGFNEEKSNRNFEAERFTCLEPQMPIPALLRHKPRDFLLDQWQESGLWTGDFEPVQHRLNAWESRANGGFGSLLRWRATS